MLFFARLSPRPAPSLTGKKTMDKTMHTHRPESTEAEMRKFIIKRIDIAQGFYSCDQMLRFAVEVFRIGAQWAQEWIDFYTRPPLDEVDILVRTGGEYNVARRCGDTVIDLATRKPLRITNETKWKYIHYPEYIKP